MKTYFVKEPLYTKSLVPCLIVVRIGALAAINRNQADPHAFAWTLKALL